MQKCSARAIVTPSGSRLDDRRMQSNGAAMRFVPGSRVILQSSVLPPTLARLGRRRLPPDRSRPRRTRRRLLVSASLQFDFIVLRALRLEPIMVALIFRRKRQTKKPRQGEPPRGGVLWVRGGRRVTIHRADLRHAFIKGDGCRFDSRLWNPEIALTTLMSGHVGQAGGSHLSSTFCAAAPATSNQHGLRPPPPPPARPPSRAPAPPAPTPAPP